MPEVPRGTHYSSQQASAALPMAGQLHARPVLLVVTHKACKGCSLSYLLGIHGRLLPLLDIPVPCQWAVSLWADLCVADSSGAVAGTHVY
jgi:hypothetical protein